MEARHKFLIILPLVLVLLAGSAAAAEVYRWVDENGEVHYSETLPPDHQDKGHDVLNRQGMVVDEDQKLTPEPPPEKPKAEEPQELPRDASGMPRPKQLYSEIELQQRMDNFLMLRYESEQEIVDAMNVEIKQLNYDRRLLEGSRASLQDAYRGQIRVAAERQRAGKEVEPAAVKEINSLHNSLAKNSKSLEGLQQREDDIRAEFDKQLARYRHLLETWSDETSGH
ncbi:MAG: DUF4124 domain-containing protein [Lysobacterales bacterium]